MLCCSRSEYEVHLDVSAPNKEEDMANTVKQPYTAADLFNGLIIIVRITQIAYKVKFHIAIETGACTQESHR